MVGIIIWIGLSVLCAILGNNRKIGFFGAFIVSFLFSPLIGIIVVALSSPSDEELIRRANLINEAHKVIEKEESVINRVSPY